MGVMMGVYMRHVKNTRPVVISRRVNILIWVLALGLMHSCMWYRGSALLYWEIVAKAFCFTISKVMWCASLSWITYACFFGYGGVVDWFLSSSFMQIGAKLVFCIYLTHILVIVNYAGGIKYRSSFSDWQAFYINCGHFIVSVLFATFLTLAFELPMVTIEKAIFGSGKPRPTAKAEVVGHDNPEKVI